MLNFIQLTLRNRNRVENGLNNDFCYFFFNFYLKIKNILPFFLRIDNIDNIFSKIYKISDFLKICFWKKFILLKIKFCDFGEGKYIANFIIHNLNLNSINKTIIFKISL